MKKRLVATFSLLFISISSLALAGPIRISSHEAFEFDATNEYQFLGTLTQANPSVSYGFVLDPTDNAYVTVAAPVELGSWLFAAIYTEPDFDGDPIVRIATESKVFAGTSYDFPLRGNISTYADDIWWLTVALPEEAYGTLDSVYGGSLSISSALSETPWFNSVDTSNGASPIPVPGTLVLIGSCLFGLVRAAVRRPIIYQD